MLFDLADLPQVAVAMTKQRDISLVYSRASGFEVEASQVFFCLFNIAN